MISYGIDCGSIVPGLSGGIENVVYGLVCALSGLVSEEERLVVLVGAGLEDRWAAEIGEPSVVIKPVLSTAQLGRSGGLVAQVKSHLRWNPLVRPLVNQIRSASVRRAGSQNISAWLYPYHRTPVRFGPTLLIVHDLRVMEPQFFDRHEASQLVDNIRRAAIVVTGWRHPAQAIQQTVPEAASKLRYVPFPVLLPARAERRRGPEENEKRLLYPAATSPHKNHRTLFEAMKTLPTNYVLTCPGPPIEPIFSELHQWLGDSGLRERVEVPGFVTPTELAQLYADADCVVLPTLWEAGSDPLLEAAHLGIPIACSDIAPLRAQVDEIGAQAHYFDPTSPAQLATAVENAIDTGCRHAVIERSTTWDQAAAAFLQILRELAHTE